MEGFPTALSANHSAVLRAVFLREDRGERLLLRADIERDLGFRAGRLGDRFQALAEKGLIRQHGKGWKSTWAARLLREKLPDMLSIPPDWTSPTLPGLDPLHPPGGSSS